MEIKAGDKVYVGWETRLSEVVRVCDFGMVEIRKTSPGGYQFTEFIDDLSVLNHKTIYQRLAELEKGKDNE